ncbi:PD-(D/E)XK nuclease family protein [Oceanospirillum linum]|uniref:Uncharacterized protein n=1 Tax=Oceanospirillum linum TaxID=966 RepID=A0A1T1HAQ9_OCELI|nr:PD-(D/E)XK nuclease family protein [Oceanospirillum linum]OOV86931.1 hypothetical protein BTA35_0211615 [Oceanospirillum linum]SEG18508.1 PD-(D/E)XK nuclease superfamily protein [Oleiphilus messinensis]SMP23926.1 PD-(D/E)XK nuclease superfamily protein [Oceanospirillum linum]
MSAKNFIDALTKMQLDPAFDTVNRLAVSRSGLDYVPMTETQKCAMLEWMLTPNEGHGLGDYFIKALLKAVYQKLGQDAGSQQHTLEARVDEIGRWYPYDALNRSFSAAFVTREVPINDPKGSSNRVGRADLVIYDEVQSTLIVIERKDGSKLSKGQLSKHYEHFEGLYRENNKISRYYLLLDSYELDHSQTTSEEDLNNWIQLGDDWIKAAIDPLLERHLIASDLREQFRYIRDYVFGYWDEDTESYYKNYDKTLLSFLHENQVHLDQLNSATIQSDVTITDINDSQLFNQLLPHSSGLDSEERQALDLYMRHMQLIQVLNDYGAMNVLQAAVHRAFSHQGEAYFASEIDSGRGRHSLLLCPKAHIPNAVQSIENDCWPYMLEITFKEGSQAEDAEPEPDTVQVWLYREPETHQELKPLAEKVWQAYKARYRENPTERKMSFRGKSQLLASFEGKQWLKLDPARGLYPLINNFKNITDSLISK